MSTDLEHFTVSHGEPRGAAPGDFRTGIYVRISSDRTGAGLGVARQEEDCRAWCARHGWTVVRVYVDNDVSAYSGKARPQWDAMLADIAAGLINAVVCWHVDRLTRSPRELEEVIDLHDRRGIMLGTVTGEMDLATASGRMLARMLGAAARHEAEHTAERRRRAALQKARAGRPHPTGNSRGYGYERDGVTIIEAEAGVIREAAERALAGEAIWAIATDFNERGILSGTGKQWKAPILHKVLVSARISGRREYHGQIMHEDSWPAIIDPARSDRLRQVLARRPGVRASDARRYMMSGIFTCGACGTPMLGRPQKTAGPRYVCAKGPGLPGCGTIFVIAARAEDRARDLVLTALDSPQFLDAVLTATAGAGTPAAQITAELREADERREELARDFAARRITRREWESAREEITATSDRLTAELARTQHSRTLASFAARAGSVWDRWEAMPPGARRALMKATVAGIPVHPAPRHGWHPTRIGTPQWRA